MSEKGSQILLAFFFVLIIGLYIGMDIQQTIDKSNTTQLDQFIFITYPEPLGPPIKGVIITDMPQVEPFIISSITPCSEPYYVNATLPDFKVDDWVKSNSNYVFFMKDSFNGQVIEINDDVVTVCINNDSYTHVNKYWLMHWECEIIMHNPDIGYFCFTELMIVPYNENTTYVTKIYAE